MMRRRKERDEIFDSNVALFNNNGGLMQIFMASGAREGNGGDGILREWKMRYICFNFPYILNYLFTMIPSRHFPTRYQTGYTLS